MPYFAAAGLLLPDIVRLLLDRGGDAAVTDGNGETPCDVLDSEDDSVRALLCR